MSKILFKSSKPFTLGCELEVRLIDKDTLKPVGKSSLIFQNVSKNLKNNIHPELLKSMAEIVTPISNTPKESVDFLKRAVDELNEIGVRHNFRLLAAGTHPFFHTSKIDIVDDPRYLSAYEEFGVLLDRFRVCGVHIHVGFSSKESVLRAYNYMIAYLPIFLALSASSPFFDGKFTKIHSFRSKIVEQIPRTDIPERFENYESFENMLDVLLKSRAIESVKDIRWDIRIHPDFGTLELRICDSMNEFERIENLIALYQAMAFYSKEGEIKNTFCQIDKQNKWYAAKYATKGKFIEDERIITIKEKAKELLKEMIEADVFEKLGLKSYENSLFELLERETISMKMIKEYQKSGNLKNIVKMGVIE